MKSEIKTDFQKSKNKKKYQRPSFTRYGALLEMTTGGTQMANEGAMAPTNRP